MTLNSNSNGWHIAMQIVPALRKACPSLCVDGKKPGTFIFLPGTDYEKHLNVSVSRLKSAADASLFYSPTALTAYKQREKWSTKLSHDHLDDTLRRFTTEFAGMEWDAAEFADAASDIIENRRYAIYFHAGLHWLGLPTPLYARTLYLQRYLLGRVKQSLIRQDKPEVWSLACKNAGNILSVHDKIVMDALRHETAYRRLYAIHPLLGMAYQPFFRKTVDEVTDETDPGNYAHRLRATLSTLGIHKTGWLRLHHLAKQKPRLAKNCLTKIFEKQSDSIPALLNHVGRTHPAHWVFPSGLNGLRESAMHQLLSFADHHLAGYRDPVHRHDADFTADVVAITAIYAAFERRNAVFDGMKDWILNVMQEPGALSRRVNSLLQRKEDLFAWVIRSNQRWHDQFHRGPVELSETDSSQTWKNIGGENAPLSVTYGDWIVTELLSGQDLSDEGAIMGHCVSTYVDQCLRHGAHIFRVTCADPSSIFHRSTLEIIRNEAGMVIRQNKSHRNAPPSPENDQITKTFLSDLIKQGEQPFISAQPPLHLHRMMP